MQSLQHHPQPGSHAPALRRGALALAPRRRADRLDTSRIGRAQAQVARELVGEAETTMARLRGAARRLRSPYQRQTVDSLARTAQATLERLAAAPDKVPTVRRFVSSTCRARPRSPKGWSLWSARPRSIRAAAPGVEATLNRLEQAFAFCPLVASRILPRIEAVLPMPDIATMLDLIGRLAT